MWNPFLVFGFMYAEPKKDFGTERDCFIYCGVNSHWEEHTLELPILPAGMRWHKIAYTGENVYEQHVIPGRQIRLMSRSLMGLIGM
jgi:glycogen operon protein